MSAHELLLFDLDGTLSDPLVGIGRSINYALEHFGFAPLELARLAVYVGPPIDATLRPSPARRPMRTSEPWLKSDSSAAGLWGYGSEAELAQEQPRYRFGEAITVRISRIQQGEVE